MKVSCLGRRTRTICITDRKEIEVGRRSIYLVEEHNLLPPKRWLENNSLPKDPEKIATAMKKNRNLRPSYRWIYQYFEFPDYKQKC